MRSSMRLVHRGLVIPPADSHERLLANSKSVPCNWTLALWTSIHRPMIQTRFEVQSIRSVNWLALAGTDSHWLVIDMAFLRDMHPYEARTDSDT